ncbi:MAG TPA: hypothetical protein DCZ20_06160 [Lachnospiraceae bacterium]|nr:hypothetical protein [Lachnospiraceae bacterium]
MLGKLLKYDLRALSRVLILAQLPILPLTGIMKHVIIPEIERHGIDFVLVCGIAAYLLYLVTASFMTSLYIAVYTYRSLFSDQGYLTLTLPASPMQHLLSKCISGSCWMFINCILTALSIAYIWFAPEIMRFLCTPNGLEFSETFVASLGGEDPVTFMIWLIALEVISCLTGPVMILGAICFGQLFNNHRLLWAVIGYTLLSIITGLFASGYSFRSIYRERINVTGNIELTVNTSAYMTDLMIFAAVLSMITALLCFLLSYWQLKKRVNLQ